MNLFTVSEISKKLEADESLVSCIGAFHGYFSEKNYRKDEGDVPRLAYSEEILHAIEKDLFLLRNREKKIKNQPAKVISLINQKGGVGKTTTTTNVSACLGLMGYKVLAIDNDPQESLSSGLTGKYDNDNSMMDIITDEVTIEKSIRKVEKFDLIVSNANMDGADVKLFNVMQREFLYKKHFEKIRDQYDFILIDCPPALGMLALNSFIASDYVLMILHASPMSMRSLRKLIDTFSLAKKVNADLAVLGILFNAFEKNRNLAKDAYVYIKDSFGDNYLRTTIKKSSSIEEAPGACMDVFSYAPGNPACKNYQELCEELVEKMEDK